MTDDEIREYLQHGAEVCHDMINVMPNAIAHRQKHLGIIDRLVEKDARIAALTEEVTQWQKSWTDLRSSLADMVADSTIDLFPTTTDALECAIEAMDAIATVEPKEPT